MIDWMEWNDATLMINLHVAFAVTGLIAGSLVMVTRKGSVFHRRMGRTFVYAAALTAAGSLLIHEIQLWGIWSPIHLLSLWVLYSLWSGIMAVRRGRVAQHASTMRLVFTSGFVVAGGFTLLPDRVLGEAFLVPLLARLPVLDTQTASGVAATMPYVGIAVAVLIYRKPILARIVKSRGSQNA